MIAAAVISGGIYVYKTFFKGNSNFKDLQKNLNANANSQGIIIIPFNSQKNKAQFYDNNRVVFFDDKDVVIAKGSYSDGGKTITLDSGKSVTGSSVYTNLINVIK